MNRIIEYYEEYNEEGRLNKDISHKLEFITTVHFLDRYINKDTRLLDVGAGAGEYSLYYAKKGIEVTAVDLSPKHIQIIKEKGLKENVSVKALVGNALNLAEFNKESFEMVLCLGPLYHLFTEGDRKACINEALRVLKPGGVFAAAYISRYATFINMIHRNTANISDEGLRNIAKTGVEFGDERDSFYHSTYEEIERLMNMDNLEKLYHIGTDGVGGTLRNLTNSFNEEEYQYWLDYHFATCTEPSLIGYSQHGLYVARKKI